MFQVKCLLHPSLNHLVINGQLKAHTIIEVTRRTFHSIPKPYDKAPISYAIIDDLRTLPVDHYPTLPPAVTSKHPWRYIEGLAERLTEDAKINETQRNKFLEDALEDMSSRPIVGARGCYQHLTFDDIGVGPQWSAERDIEMHADSIDQLFELPDKEKLCNLSELSTAFTLVTADKAAPSDPSFNGDAARPSLSQSHKFIVARILGKSRLTYYGKSDNSERWAFKFSLRIVDLSGIEVDIFFWGATVPALYHSLKVSQIVKLSGLKLKTLFPGGPQSYSSLLTGRAYKPPFEITYNPTSKERKFIAVLTGAVAEWFDAKIATLPLSCSIATLRDRMISEESDVTTIVKELLDGIQSKTAAAPLTSVHGLVSWVGPVEVRPHFGIRVYSRWIYLIDPIESTEHESRGAFIQVRLGPSIEIPHALSATHIRMELHHGHIVGIATPFSEFKAWDDANVDLAETNKELPELAAKYHDLCSSWPFTLPFEEPSDYARVSGAKLITNFLKPLPSTRPDSEDEAMDVEETPEPHELLTQDPANQLPTAGGRSMRNSFSRSAATAKSANGDAAKGAKLRKKDARLGQGEKAIGGAAESSLRWIEKLGPQMRVDRIVACDKPFASAFLFAGDYDASKICGVKTEEEVDAIVALGNDQAERAPPKKPRRKKGAVEQAPERAELFWIAFSAHPVELPADDRPVADAASMAVVNSHDDEELSQSQSTAKKTSRKRAASDPSKASSSRAKRRAVIKSPPLYFCAVMPISPMHFSYGNAYSFERIQEDRPGLLDAIGRRLQLAPSLNKKYSLLVGVTIYKHSAEDARITVNDVWREPRKPTPATDLRKGLASFVDNTSSGLTDGAK